MSDNKNEKLTYGHSYDEWYNHLTDKLLSVNHSQWKQQHREVFLDYHDYLTEHYETFGCTLIGYCFTSESDTLIVKMLDNHHNLLKSPAEQSTPPVFASVRIRSATPEEENRVSKSKPIPRRTLYMAEQYYKQWVEDDETLPSLASVLLFFIHTYTQIYRYMTLEVKLAGVGSPDPSFQIKVSDGKQTIEFVLNYVVLDKEYKDFLKRAKVN